MPFWFSNILLLLSGSNSAYTPEEREKLLRQQEEYRKKQKAFNRSAAGLTQRIGHAGVFISCLTLLCDKLGRTPPTELFGALHFNTLPESVFFSIATYGKSLLFKIFAIFQFNPSLMIMTLFFGCYGTMEILRQIYYRWKRKHNRNHNTE